MKDHTQNRIQQIQIENKIWIIYLIIIALSYQSNYYEKDYFINQHQTSKNKYRKLNILIFTMLAFIYAYFEKESLNSLLQQKKTNKLTELSFIASTLVLIAGIIYLYIVVKDEEIEEEIAFN